MRRKKKKKKKKKIQGTYCSNPAASQLLFETTSEGLSATCKELPRIICM